MGVGELGFVVVGMPRSTDRSARWPDGLDDRRRCGARRGVADWGIDGFALAMGITRRHAARHLYTQHLFITVLEFFGFRNSRTFRSLLAFFGLLY